MGGKNKDKDKGMGKNREKEGLGGRVLITVRMRLEEREMLKEAAWRERLSLNEFCKRVLLKDAEGRLRKFLDW